MKHTRRTTRGRLPAFRARKDFVRFVETHDLANYWDEFEEVREPLEVEPELARSIDRRVHRKELISLRLEGWQIRLARAVAARERIAYHAVIRRWIEEGLTGSRRRPRLA